MKPTFKTLAFVTALQALAAPALAGNDLPNWYVSLHGGMNFYPDSTVEIVGVGSGELSTDTGFDIGGAIGYAPSTPLWFFESPRFELEYTYRTNDADKLANVVLDGDIQTNALMGNVLFDFYNDTRLTPYVGGGLGWVWIDTQNGTAKADTDMFAWQLMAGVGFDPEALPNTSINLGYRYFGAEDAEYPAGTTKVLQEYSSHSVEAGVRYHF